MTKAIILFVVSLVLLAPVCVYGGYAIGHLIAAFVYPTTVPDTFKADRELFAGIYGVMFIGGFLYLVSAVFALFRMVKAVRKARSGGARPLR